VDHVEKYKRPKTKEGETHPENEEEAMNCAPQPIEGKINGILYYSIV
jgi:hypothetical protein